MFWLSMAKQISEHFALCAVCKRHQYFNTKEACKVNMTY
jgi:hypothetical protein